MRRKVKSEVLSMVHEGALAMRQAGIIDARRMKQYDALCLAPIEPYSAPKVRALRKRLAVSQAVLASLLNASLSTVRQWEQGLKKPAGPSAKLLDLLNRKGLEVLL